MSSLNSKQQAHPIADDSKVGSIFQWLGVLLLTYLLITAVGIIGSGFKSAAGDQAKELFAFATNPFLGLLVGTVATALIQSSSTVTSIIVGLVAGGLPVGVAVPMVMGANIGTTITNTIVSMGHVSDKDEFKRAFAAATIHDYFNLLSVIIFLPIEILFHPLERLGQMLATAMVGGSSLSVSNLNFIKAITKPFITAVSDFMAFLPHPYNGIALIIIGVAFIFIAITYIGKLLRVLMVGRAKQILNKSVGRGPISGIVAGTIITILVQSSSTTTSLIVPLAGTAVFTLAQVYPFTLGANIGTTITALLAATAITGEAALPALQIAIIHLLYNLIGVVVIYGVPYLRNLPIKGANWLADAATERKSFAVGYIICVFFIIPALLIGASILI